jgi:hypothetical protein
MGAAFVQPGAGHIAAFVLIALGVLAWLVRPLRIAPRAVLLLLGWQTLIASFALVGYFARFDQPWRALPLVALTLAAAVWLAHRPWHTAIGRWLAQTPVWAWAALQTFRLPLEVLLYSLYAHGVIGKHMTWAGYNFDVLIGVTAPVIAWLLFRYGDRRAVRRLALLWNLAGLVLLANIVLIAVLSIPFPFQWFTAEPANRFVAQLPFVWLPTFLVPIALLAHLCSVRLLRRAHTRLSQLV